MKNLALSDWIHIVSFPSIKVCPIRSQPFNTLFHFTLPEYKNWSVIYTQEDCRDHCGENGGFCRGCAGSQDALCCSGNRNQNKILKQYNSEVCTSPVADAINVQYTYEDGFFCVKLNNGEGRSVCQPQVAN